MFEDVVALPSLLFSADARRLFAGADMPATPLTRADNTPSYAPRR